MGEYLKYEISTPKFIANLVTNVPYNYEIQSMSKNTSNGDFGMSFYGDKVSFASLRNSESKSFGWNDKPYLDLFSANVSDKGLLANVEPFPKEINTKTHESSATFSADGRIMYFNRTNDKKVKIGDEKIAVIKIFKAEFIDGKWSNVKELPFCSDIYSTERGFKDGRNYISRYLRTLGSFDIFVVDVNEDGTLGPQNLVKL